MRIIRKWRVLIACEFSGRVSQAFRDRGHDAISCDLLPTEGKGPHMQGDVRPLLAERWDLIIAFPPCTYLAASGAKWWANRQDEQELAIKFVLEIMDANSPRIAVENPVGKLSTAIRKPDQIVDPWWFGDPEVKRTCLWLKGLPLLRADRISNGRAASVHWMSGNPGRSHDRSRTFPGMARAMASQWG